MNRPNNGENSSLYDRVLRGGVKLGVVVVVVLVVGAMGIGMAPMANAQDGGGDSANTTFAVKQGSTCYTVTPMGNGSDNVVSYYNYRTHGHGYSSRGTRDLQVEDTSQFFFYRGNGGLSLVFLHDKFTGNATTGGGAISLVMTGMPVTGGWTVKDDGYAGANDTFTFNKSMTTATWGWRPGRSDGAVYRADPSEWNKEITIKPRFNKEAESYPYPGWEGEGTMNQVERWIVRSGDGKAHALNLYEDVTITRGSCDGQESMNGTESIESGQNQASNNQQNTNEESDSGLKTIASGPGFGVVLTIAALAVALVAIVARRRL